MAKRKSDLLLIDGYNLLNASTIVGQGGRTALESSREALLDWLTQVLDETESHRVTIVFDGRDAPPGLPRQMSHQGIRIRFARRREEADDVLEELIAIHHAPKSLLVVSSDHRVQRAARRRKAQAIDSEVWFAQRSRRSHPDAPTTDRDKKLSEEEVDSWLKEFGEPGKE